MTTPSKPDPKGKATRQNVEMAFDRFCANGGNKARTLSDLKARGLSLTRTTLDRWVDDCAFARRMFEIDDARQRARVRVAGLDEEVLGALIRRKEEYDRYFDSQGEPDDPRPPKFMDIFAYVSILGKIAAVKAGVRPEATETGDEDRRAINERIRETYGI